MNAALYSTASTRFRKAISWKPISWWRCPGKASGFAGKVSMRKNSIKNTRINAQVQQVLAETIRGEIKDPRIAPFTSVVAVEVAPDLKTCRAWISVLGDEKAQEDTLAGLKSAEGFLKSRLAKEINLRITPEITFVMDQSIAYGVNMSHKIDEVMEKERREEE